MRTLTILIASLFVTGCLEVEEPTTSEASEDITISITNPYLVVSARSARLRNAAYEMRVLAATKPPLYPTWTVLQQYRTFVAFANSAAEPYTSALSTLPLMTAA